MSCIICDAESKYKCPVCREPYCSVVCCKQHKESKCSPPSSPENVEEEKSSSLSTYRFPTEDTVPVEKLQLLEQSEGLRNCIRNPHLRDILKSLDSCDAPAQMLKNFMQEPIFVEYVEECLKVIAPEENKKKPDILEELLTS